MSNAAVEETKEIKVVKFGDICKEIKLSTKDPIADGYERYIGLEHIDTGSLKIKRWGLIAEDNPSFTRVFKKGQILFGKRRPYLRKAAIAEFDGICSGDIIVMEPKEGYVVPELLPFIVQSEKVWNWASKTSSGSLSPRTKFKALSDIEMVLPNTSKQIAIKNILEKLEEIEAECYGLIDSAFSIEDLMIVNFINNNKKKTIRRCHLDEVSEKITVGIVNKPADLYVESGVPALRSQNVQRGYVQTDNMVYISNAGHVKHKKSQLSEGDVVVVRTGYPGTASVVPRELHGSNCIDILIVKCDKNILLPDYVAAYINSPLGKGQVLEGAGGLAQQHFNVKALKEMYIDIPSLEDQQKVVDILHSLTSTSHLISIYLKEKVNMSNALKNRILGGK